MKISVREKLHTNYADINDSWHACVTHERDYFFFSSLGINTRRNCNQKKTCRTRNALSHTHSQLIQRGMQSFVESIRDKESFKYSRGFAGSGGTSVNCNSNNNNKIELKTRVYSGQLASAITICRKGLITRAWSVPFCRI